MFSSLSGGDIVQVVVTGLTILISLAIFFQEKRAKTPPAPTLPWVRKTIVSLFAEYIPADAAIKMVDLGCGWGGMTVALAKRFRRAEIHGYEITTFPFLMSKLVGFLFMGRIKIHNSDMYQADLTQFQAIYTYLPTFILTDLLPQFAKLNKGTLIITSGWAIPGYTPKRVVEESIFGLKMPIHIYQVE